MDLIAIAARRPGLHRVALWNLTLGTIGAGVAVLSGLQAEDVANVVESITIKQKDNLNYYLPYLKGMTSLSLVENKKAHAEVAANFATQLLAQPTLKGEERSNTLYQRALAYSAIQDQAKAIGDLQEAVRITPNHLGARVDLGGALASIGQTAAAMTAYNDAVKAFPNMPLVYNNRGFFQQSIGKLDDAIIDFSKAIELDPQFIEAISNRGFVSLNKGNYESAEADFTQSLALNAAQPSVLSLRAGSKLSRGDVEAAIADYRDVLKWDTKNSYGHAELGFALFFAGKTQEALAELDTVSELDPKLRFVLPWRYLAMLALGQKAQADAKFAADLAIPQAKREWPDQLLVYLGDKQSEQDLRKSINKDPKAADAQFCEAEFFIGQRKFVAGQKDAAKVHFAAALKSKATQLAAYRGAKLAVK